MKKRRIGQYRVASHSQDGAGVKMRRVFWQKDDMDIDPFLLLDVFDHTDPQDYIKGFPMHPHRGIETFTYLISGEIHHKDSLGNQGVIGDGEYQWMRAGSGILHEEMPKAAPHMLGFQLWINMPAAEKMSEPQYLEGNAETIPEVKKEGLILRVLAGQFDGVEKKDVPGYDLLEMYDIQLEGGHTVTLPVNEEDGAFVSVLQGEIEINGSTLVEKSAATLVEGDAVEITAKTDARFMFFAGRPLREPVAWGGPIVMNTEEELENAFLEIEHGTFIKHSPAGQKE